MLVSIGYILNTVTNCCLGTLNGMGKPARSMFLMRFYYIVTLSFGCPWPISSPVWALD